ncbi:MAG: P-II family nitrogen regulator [Thiogranum sp.]|nr:P-II family nitrogen regulator [Thiogranum sp.]
MDFRKITAIIRIGKAEQVEQTLKSIGVPGMSCTHVKGYGEYANFYSSDWQVEHARVEIFVRASQADEVARTIMEAARTGVSGDGIVAVLPVEHLYHIKTGEESRENPG